MENNNKNISVRPWGKFRDHWHAQGWHLKTIEVNANSRLSLQSHKKRKEIWVVVEGDIGAQAGEKIANYQPGDIIIIEKGQKHRLFSGKGGKVAEISFGEFDENDIARYEDDYGRAQA